MVIGVWMKTYARRYNTVNEELAWSVKEPRGLGRHQGADPYS